MTHHPLLEHRLGVTEVMGKAGGAERANRKVCWAERANRKVWWVRP